MRAKPQPMIVLLPISSITWASTFFLSSTPKCSNTLLAGTHTRSCALGVVAIRSDVVDHECGQVDLLSSVHQISEALVHRIGLFAPLRMWNDVLDYKPEDQLMERLHIVLLHCLWTF